MRHSQIRELLGDYAAGRVEDDSRDQIEAHLARCEGCSGWLDTYRLYADLLGPVAANSLEDHPSVERIAAHALGKQDPGDPELEAVTRHLEDCSACRRETELTRQAILEASNGDFATDSLYEEPAYLQPRWGLALAASLVFAVLATSALWVSRSGMTDATSRPLAGTILEGVQVIESAGPMLATDTEVRARADVTLRANGAVAFGEGFSVGPGATLVVEVTDLDTDSHES